MSISPKRLEELKAISEEDIDTSDIPELDENFWSKAQVVMPESKKAISLRVERDVLEWFQNQGK